MIQYLIHFRSWRRIRHIFVNLGHRRCTGRNKAEEQLPAQAEAVPERAGRPSPQWGKRSARSRPRHAHSEAAHNTSLRTDCVLTYFKRIRIRCKEICSRVFSLVNEVLLSEGAGVRGDTAQAGKSGSPVVSPTCNSLDMVLFLWHDGFIIHFNS